MLTWGGNRCPESAEYATGAIEHYYSNTKKIPIKIVDGDYQLTPSLLRSFLTTIKYKLSIYLQGTRILFQIYAFRDD